MRKAISSILLSSLVVAATALPALAGDISATGQFQSTFTDSVTSDPTLNSTFQLDLKGAMTDTFDIDARILFKRNLTIDKYTHFAVVPNFDNIQFDNYRITHHNTLNIAGSDLKYSVDFTRFINVPTSADPMTLIYEKGSSGEVVEFAGSYKNYESRLGVMGGAAGRWYAQVLANDVVPGLQLGALSYNEFLPGINPEDLNTFNKPVLADYVNSVFGTYKPTDNALKGLELNVGYYMSRNPDSTARPTGPVLETDEFTLTADQLAAQGMRNVIGKGYTIVIRGEFSKEAGSDAWCPGNHNWDKLQTEDLVVKEVDGKLVIYGKDLLAIAKKNGRESDLSRDNSRYGGIKLVAFDSAGNRVMQDGQFSNNTQLSTLLTDPTKGKVNGTAAVILGKYERGPLTVNLDAKNLSKTFGATTTNFNVKSDAVVLDGGRAEGKLPYVQTTRFSTSAGYPDYPTEYGLYDASTTGLVKIAPSVAYDLNDKVTVTLDTAYKRAERSAVALTGVNVNTGWTTDLTYYYSLVRPKVNVNIGDKYALEAYGEMENLKIKYGTRHAAVTNGVVTGSVPTNLPAATDDLGKIRSYYVSAQANDVIPYVESAKLTYQGRQLGATTGNIGNKDTNKNQVDLEVNSVTYKDFKYKGTFRVEGKAYNDAAAANSAGRIIGQTTPQKSILFNQVTYTGVKDLEVKVASKVAYDREKTGSQWNLAIGEVNYKILDTPYKAANNIELKFLGKYNLCEEKNDGTNKASMYFSAKKSFTDLTTLELKYGSDADFYEHDKNQTQKKETTLEFISRF